MKTIYGLRDELKYIFSRAQLAAWMLGINSGDFCRILPGDEASDDPVQKKLCEKKQNLADFIYNQPDQWMSDFKFIIDGGADGAATENKGSSRDRKMIGAAILTSGMIHVCQSQIYNPDQLGFHMGFSQFINSVKSWSEAGETVTLLSGYRFLFISEVFLPDDVHKTLSSTVSETLNDLLERRENKNFVTILSLKPAMIARAAIDSSCLGAAMRSWLEQAGDGSSLKKDKRLVRIAF